MANILQLKNINKVYGDKIKTQVLFDVNLSFQEGSFTFPLSVSREVENIPKQFMACCRI